MKKQLVHVGTIGKPHGVRGLVRIHSNLENAQDLELYSELLDDHGESWTLAWRNEPVAILYDGNGKQVDSRTYVEKLTNRKLYVPRNSFPQPEEDEFYLMDLKGLNAIVRQDGLDGERHGTVHMIHDYGAGTSLELRLDNKETVLVPFTKACVPEINIEAGWLMVCLPHEIEVSPPTEGGKS